MLAAMDGDMDELEDGEEVGEGVRIVELEEVLVSWDDGEGETAVAFPGVDGKALAAAVRDADDEALAALGLAVGEVVDEPEGDEVEDGDADTDGDAEGEEVGVGLGTAMSVREPCTVVHDNVVAPAGQRTTAVPSSAGNAVTVHAPAREVAVRPGSAAIPVMLHSVTLADDSHVHVPSWPRPDEPHMRAGRMARTR